MTIPSGTDRTAQRPRSVVLVMAMVASFLVVLTNPDVAAASWSATTAPGGQARADAQGMVGGQTPSAAAQPTTSNDVVVNWAASTGGPLTGYDVLAYDADTAEPRAVGGTCAGLVTATTCTDVDAPDGRWVYTVTPRSGGWTGAASAPSALVVVDTVPPTVTIDFPTPGGAYNAASWNAGCPEPGFCGGADDVGSGLVAGGVSVQQVSTGLYWDGTAFASPVRVLLQIPGGNPDTTGWAFPIDNFPTDGQYTEQAVATDAVGNTTTASVTFTIDRDGPVTPGGFPLPGGVYGVELWNAGCPQPGFCAVGEVPADIVGGGLSVLQVDTGLYWDGTAFTSTTELLLPLPTTTDMWLFPISNFPADGPYSIRAVLTDSAGNDTVTVVPFAIDRVAPVISPLFPINGGVYDVAGWDAGCPTPGLCGTVTDDNELVSGLVTLRQVATGLYWDGSAFAAETEQPVLFDSAGSIPFPAANFAADGVYTAQIVVRDRAGNDANLTRTFTIDRDAPIVDIQFPLDGTTYSTATWNAGCPTPGFCGTASDSGSGLSNQQISIRRDADGTYWNGSAFTGTTETLLSMTGDDFAFAASRFPTDGSYTVRVEATDFGGHTATDTATFTIDRTAPTVAVTFPADGGTYNAASWAAGCPTANICTTATDAGTVAAHAVSIRQGTGNYWNGTAFASATEVLLPVLGTGRLAFPAANFTVDGAYTVRAVATDAVGNAAAATSTFTIDKTAPRVTAMTQTDANGFLAPGDELAIRFSEPLDLATLCSTWSGTGDRSLTNVTVNVNSAIGIYDVVGDITSPTCTLRAGSLETNNDYTPGSTIFSLSTLTWTESTRTLTLRFGVRTWGISNWFPNLPDTSVYTVSPGVTDRAGNAVSPVTFSVDNVRF